MKSQIIFVLIVGLALAEKVDYSIVQYTEDQIQNDARVGKIIDSLIQELIRQTRLDGASSWTQSRILNTWFQNGKNRYFLEFEITDGTTKRYVGTSVKVKTDNAFKFNYIDLGATA